MESDRNSQQAVGPAPGDRVQADKPLMVLHIGMHKTGTTSIQEYFSQHAEQLRAAGYVYPSAGRYREQHSVLPGTFLGDHRFLPKDITQTPREDVLAEIADEVRPGESAVLSSEVFWELLIHRPDDFEECLLRLAQDWRMLLVYFARDLNAKSWSAVKHLGRLGALSDPVGAYRSDLELTAQSEQRLRSAHPDALRVAFDGRDSVSQMVDLLGSPSLARFGGRTPAELAELAKLRSQRERRSRRRVNSDLRNPFGPAVSLCVAAHLTPGDSDDLRYAMLPRLYDQVFRSRDGGWSQRGLPTDQELHERVRRLAQTSGGELFNVAERRAVVAGLTSRRVRWRANAARCTASLRLATDAVRTSIPEP